jgi:hypothetical protein
VNSFSGCCRSRSIHRRICNGNPYRDAPPAPVVVQRVDEKANPGPRPNHSSGSPIPTGHRRQTRAAPSRLGWVRAVTPTRVAAFGGYTANEPGRPARGGRPAPRSSIRLNAIVSRRPMRGSAARKSATIVLNRSSTAAGRSSAARPLRHMIHKERRRRIRHRPA